MSYPERGRDMIDLPVTPGATRDKRVWPQVHGVLIGGSTESARLVTVDGHSGARRRTGRHWAQPDTSLQRTGRRDPTLVRRISRLVGRR